MTYFDCAATSFPKPPEVREAVIRAIEKEGGNAGRGAHALSLAATERVYSCREVTARFIGSAHPETVVFTMNATYALNIAIKALIKPRSRVVCTSFEHNSVIRPLTAMGCRITRIDPRAGEDEFIASLRREIARRTDAVVITHASNVIPLSVPVGRAAVLCRAAKVPCIVDASQSAGTIPLDMQSVPADAICFPAHKGLQGIAGCGVCVFGEQYRENACALSSVIEGGSGVNSLERGMPAVLPERFEAGTLCIPAIAGLEAGIRFIERIGVDAVREHEFTLARKLRDLLRAVNGVKVYDPVGRGGGVVLFNVGDKPPEHVARELNEHGFCVRAGLHCAPDAHKSLGTLPRGAVRASFGVFNTENEVDKLLCALDAIRKT